MENDSVVKVIIKKVAREIITECEDELAVEEPLEIQLIFGKNNERIRKSVSVTMRTPGKDEELGIGFLFTEGIIKNRDQVFGIKTDGNILQITLNENVIPFLNKTKEIFIFLQAVVSAESPA